MVTTITPRLASVSPQYRGIEPDACVNPPPGIHTITGNLWRGATADVQMLSVRQSSLIGSASAPGTDTPLCIQIGPKVVACRTPLHRNGGWGDFHRSPSTGAAAYGIDL